MTINIHESKYNASHLIFNEKTERFRIPQIPYMKPSISSTGGKNGFVVWRPLNLRFRRNMRKTSIIIIIMTIITTLRFTVIYKNLVLSNELIKVELQYHRERFRKLTFRALVLRQTEWRLFSWAQVLHKLGGWKSNYIEVFGDNWQPNVKDLIKQKKHDTFWLNKI